MRIRFAFLMTMLLVAGCVSQPIDMAFFPQPVDTLSSRDLAKSGQATLDKALPFRVPPDLPVNLATERRELIMVVSSGPLTRTTPAKARPVRGERTMDTRATAAVDSENVSGVAAVEMSRSGSMAYHIPKNMRLNRASSVELWIDLSAPADVLKRELAEKLGIDQEKIKIALRASNRISTDGKPSEIVGREGIWVGKHMTAKLSASASDFKIEPEAARGKSLQGDGRARWDWTVKPIRDSGDEPMILTLEAAIDRGVDQDSFPSVKESIEVQLPVWWQRIPALIDELGKRISALNTLLSLLGVASFAGAAAWVRAKVSKFFRDRRVREQPLPVVDMAA